MVLNTYLAGVAKQALINQGINTTQVNLIMAQSAHESWGFTSGQANDDNNFSGILYAEQRNAVLSPKHSNQDSHKGTAKFATPDDWARAMVRNVSKTNGGKGKPIDATDVGTYTDRLKANNYFGNGSSAAYAAGINRWMKQLGGVVPQGVVNSAASSVTDSNDTESNAKLKKDLGINLAAIQANVDAAEQDNVNVDWGSRQNGQEASDWIGLRQFIMYLCTTYMPTSVVPFIELIPKFLLDESKTVTSAEANAFEYQISDKDLKRFNEARKKINSSADQGGIDLFTIDPFKDNEKFNQDSDKRNFGYRIFGMVSISPSIQGSELSKAGPIGFKSLEIAVGAADQQGIPLITMKIVDLQGNKFFDLSSPWSFILNSSQVHGDFYFRYGWQLRIPSKNDDKNTNSESYKFWNHPGWKIFGNGNDSAIEALKNNISHRATVANHVLTFTQSPNLDSVNYAGYQETTRKNDKGFDEGIFTITRMPDISNYMIISLINPELSVDDTTGSISATLQFRMNTSLANCSCPLFEATEVNKLIVENSQTNLYSLMVAFLSDNKSYTKKQTGSKFDEALIDPGKGDDWLIVKRLSSSSVNLSSVDSRSIKIGIPNSLRAEMNNNINQKDTNVSLLAWLTKVCESNYLTLTSAGDQNITQNSGFYFLWDDVSNKSADNTYDNDAALGFLGNSSITRLVSQDDVFSFKFRGSLVESISLSNQENPTMQNYKNEAELAKQAVAKGDITTAGVDGNKTSNTNASVKSPIKPVTWNEKQTNLQYQLSKISAVTIKAIGHPWLRVNYNIYVKGMTYFDGKYHISRLKHIIGEDGKFITEINAVKILFDTDYTAKQNEIINSKKQAQEQVSSKNIAQDLVSVKTTTGTLNFIGL